MSLAVVYTRAKLGINAPWCPSKSISPMACPAFIWSACRKPQSKKVKTACAAPLSTPTLISPPRRITVNLAPAELPKEGSRFDIAIAIAILAASEQIPRDQLEDYEFIGELALSGEIRPVDAVLPAALACASRSKQLIIGRDNAPEASWLATLSILPAKHLLEISAHLHQRQLLSHGSIKPLPPQQKTQESCALLNKELIKS